MAKKKKKSANTPLFLRILLFPLSLFVLILLPFVLMIRVSVLMYNLTGMNGWLALGIGVLLALIPVYFYVRWVVRKLRGKKKEKPEHRRRSFRIAVGLLAGYCIFAMFYISGVNVKSQDMRSEYTSLHPILRMSMSSLILFDRSLVVTDLGRTHGDYGDMNLKALKNSMHYVQEDGFVHAADVRTIGRPEWRNTISRLYFNLMGFKTIRHVGTADHLHVALPLAE